MDAPKFKPGSVVYFDPKEYMRQKIVCSTVESATFFAGHWEYKTACGFKCSEWDLFETPDLKRTEKKEIEACPFCGTNPNKIGCERFRIRHADDCVLADIHIPQLNLDQWNTRKG